MQMHVHEHSITDEEAHRDADIGSNAEIDRLLTAHGVKPTLQRVAVAKMLLAKPAHLSADQIIAALSASGLRISKATVYNTLKTLTDCGLVRQIHLDPDRSVYDSTCGFHHHFHDVESGRLWDIQPQEVEFSRLPQLPDGMETAGVEVVIRVRRRAAQ